MQGRGPIPFPILMRVGELLAEFVAMGCEILACECNVSAAEGAFIRTPRERGILPGGRLREVEDQKS